VIVGSSVHNQHIERLWRDVFSGVTQSLYSLFYKLEELGLLDPLDDTNLYALHFMYLPRINQCLFDFTNSWNNHPLRTCHGSTPLQLYNLGMIVLKTDNVAALDYYAPIVDEYGEEFSEESLLCPDSSECVQVPSTFPITTTNLDELSSVINPKTDSDSCGVVIYLEVMDYLNDD
jgi:hypothetical protein